MSKRSSAASEVHGFISIANDKTSTTSKTVKITKGSKPGVQGSTSRTEPTPKSKDATDRKNSVESTVVKSKVVDPKVNKRKDAPLRTTLGKVAPPRSTAAATPRTTAAVANTTSVSKTQSVNTKSQVASSKTPSSQKSKASTSKLGISTRTTTTRNLKVTTVPTKPGGKKTQISASKIKVVSEPVVKRNTTAPTTKPHVKTQLHNRKEKLTSNSIDKTKRPSLVVSKQINPVKSLDDKTVRIEEAEELKDHVADIKAQPAGPKREGTWVKEESDQSLEQETDVKPSDGTEQHQEKVDETQQSIDDSRNNNFQGNEEVSETEEGQTSLEPTLSDQEPYYEDDFEVYESDFEEYESDESGVSSSGSASEPSESCTSSESSEEDGLSKGRPDDKKLDSGNYDMRKSRTGFYHPPPTSCRVQEENECPQVSQNSVKEQRSFYSDETIEWRPPVKQAKMGKVKQRGEKLLEMIKLDITSINLLTMAPIPYDIFIKVYGKKNTQQTSVQTNEDCSDQEVQTDEIKLKDKWTQFPVKYHSWGDNVEDSLTRFYKDRNGVGDDNPVNTEFDNKLTYDTTKLNRFLDYAAEVMVVSLEEAGLVERGRASAVKSDLPFSQGCLVINSCYQEHLRGRHPSLLTFSPHNPNYILVVYPPHHSKNEVEEYWSRCIVCLWNVLGGDTPPKSSLIAPCCVTSVAFDLLHPNIIYAGLIDGGVCVWELKDKGIRLNIGSDKLKLRPASYSTCGVMGDKGHISAVISVQSLTLMAAKPCDTFIPGQLASLEELGKVILWSVVARRPWEAPLQSTEITSDLGAAPWATLTLTHSLTVMPFHQIPRCMPDEGDNGGLCTCMVRLPETCSVLIGSDEGEVALCSLLVFDPRRSFYKHNQNSERPSVTCIEVCPTNSQLFMVGLSSGVLRLHLIGRSRPLRIFSCLLGSVMPPVANIAISSQRPGLVFASHFNSTMYVWNICESDIAPLFPVKLKDADMSTTALTTNGKSSYLAVANKDSVQIHKIKKEFTTTNGLEQKIFSTYVTLV